MTKETLRDSHSQELNNIETEFLKQQMQSRDGVIS